MQQKKLLQSNVLNLAEKAPDQLNQLPQNPDQKPAVKVPSALNNPKLWGPHILDQAQRQQDAAKAAAKAAPNAVIQPDAGAQVN